MGKIVRLALASALACGLLPPTGTAAPAMPDTPAMPDKADVIFEGLKALRNDGKCDRVLDRLAQPPLSVWIDTGPDTLRLALDWVGASCGLQTKRPALALKFAKAGTVFENPPADLWIWRLDAASQAGELAETVITLEQMSAKNPEMLNTINTRYLFGLSRKLKEQGNKPLRLRFLKVLSNPQYVPADPAKSADGFRYTYASLLAADGDKTAAAELLTRITDPALLLKASLDAGLRTLIPPDYDMHAAIERHMAHMRDLAASHPDSLEPAIHVAEDYLKLDQAEQAIVVLQAVRPDGANSQKFNDQADEESWWWDTLADAYEQANRYDDAAAAYRRGAALGENGNAVNVSQSINLAGMQNQFGHYAEALQALAPLLAAGKAPVSPFGYMALHQAAGCANAKLGNTDAAAADLAYLRAHEDISRHMLVELQLCTGDLDGAAATQIRMLEQPDDRADALRELSDYAPPPPSHRKGPSELGFEALKKRPDVQAAITRAGGIRRFNIPYQ